MSKQKVIPTLQLTAVFSREVVLYVRLLYCLLLFCNYYPICICFFVYLRV